MHFQQAKTGCCLAHSVTKCSALSHAQQIDIVLDSVPGLLAALLKAADEATAAAGSADTAQQLALVSTHRSALQIAVQQLLCNDGREFKPLCQVRQQLPAVMAVAGPLADALLAWWRRPEAQQAAALELAQAAARRSCAYLRCANLGGEGGPAAGEGAGSMRCR